MQWPPPRPRPSSRAADGDHLDAGLAQQRVGVGVAVVGDDDAGLERHDVVAVVPLLALGLVGVAAGLDHAQLVEPQRVADDVEDRPCRRRGPRSRRRPTVGWVLIAADLVDHLAEDRDQVAVAEAEHRVEVHGGAALRHQAADHPRCRLVAEQLARDLQHGLPRGALAHADQHDALADRHDVAAFHRGRGEVLVGVAPPDLEVAALEHRVELVDGALQQGLGLARRPEHRIAGDAVVDPAGRVALEQRVGDRRDDEVRPGEGLLEHPRRFARRQVD